MTNNPQKELVETLASHFEYLTLNYPAISNVHVVSAANNCLTLKAVYSQPHMREQLSHTNSHFFTYDPSASPSIRQFPSFPASENEVQAEVYSPSKNFRALFRKSGDKTSLEIWGKNGLIKSIKVSDLHGAIYNDAQFCLEGLRWSQDEKRIVYIAEKKEEKYPKYFDDLTTDEEVSKAFKGFEYRQDLGEGYRGKVTPSLFVYDVREEQVYRVTNLPVELIPTQVSFADKEGKSMVFCGYKYPNVRQGLKFCYNRDSKIYHIKNVVLERMKEDKSKKLSEEEKKNQKEQIRKEGDENPPKLISNDDIAIFPIISQDFTKLVYLFSPWKVTHTTGLGLKLIDLSNGVGENITPKVVVDIVQEPNENFAGFMGYHDRFNKMRFIGGNKYVVFNSDIRSGAGLFVVNLENGEVKRIDQPRYRSEEWRLTAIHENTILVRISNITGQNMVGICQNFNSAAASLEEVVKNIKWDISEIDPKQAASIGENKFAFLSKLGEVEERIINHKGIDSIFFSLKGAEGAKRPLMVLLHGGPHGALTGLFTVSKHYALYKGYNLLCPNFTGSTGYGQKFLDNLPTKIGQIDSDEVFAAIDYCVKNGLADSSKVVVVGGSYGGYLPCVMMAQHPELFKCAIIRNPVVSVGYCYEGSDIPEWAFGETFNKDHEYEVNGDVLKKMYEISPIGMNRDIKTSILLMLGGKDKRVPPEAGVQYYKALKHQGVDISLLYYPEDEHGLAASPETETDQFIRMYAYLENKL